MMWKIFKKKSKLENKDSKNDVEPEDLDERNIDEKVNDLISLILQRDKIDHSKTEINCNKIFDYENAKNVNYKNFERIISALSSREKPNFLDEYICTLFKESISQDAELLKIVLRYKNRNAIQSFFRQWALTLSSIDDYELNFRDKRLNDFRLYEYDVENHLLYLQKTYQTLNDDQAFLLATTAIDDNVLSNESYIKIYELITTNSRYKPGNENQISFYEEKTLNFLKNIAEPSAEKKIAKRFDLSTYSTIVLSMVTSTLHDSNEEPESLEQAMNKQTIEQFFSLGYKKYSNGLHIYSSDGMVGTYGIQEVDIELILTRTNEEYEKQVKYAHEHSYLLAESIIQNTEKANKIAIIDFFENPEDDLFPNNLHVEPYTEGPFEICMFIGVPAVCRNNLTIIIKDFN